MYEELKYQGFEDRALSALFVPLEQNQKLWDFIDTTSENIWKGYWENMHPRFYNNSVEEKIQGIHSLMLNRRYISSVNIASHIVEELSSDLIIKILEKAALERSEEDAQFSTYSIPMLFESLGKRTDYNIQSLFNLEWIYLSVLTNYRSRSIPLRLHQELASNPTFFMKLIRWIYKPESETKLEEKQDSLTKEQILNRRNKSNDLLRTWEKIPGVGDSFNIDESILKEWITTARQLAVECGRKGITDNYIGKILSRYPKKKDINWPPEIICRIIEELDSTQVNDGFYIGTFNHGGTTVRATYAGGNIERGRAKYFNDLSEIHRNKFPTLSSIFEKLAREYESHARQMDDEAERDQLDC